MSDESMLAKVRALLALAEGASTQAEADLAMSRAEALIAKYGIDQALLADAGTIRDDVVDRAMVLPDPYARAKANLLVCVARPLRVRVLFNTGASRNIKGFRVHMFGHQADMERVEILFTSLLVQATTGLANVRPAHRGSIYDSAGAPTAGAVAAFRRDWLEGFGAAVQRRLEDAEQRASRGTGTGTDLVLVSRNSAVDDAVDAAYPKIGSAASRPIRDEGAFRAGARVGATADLGAKRIGGTT